MFGNSASSGKGLFEGRINKIRTDGRGHANFKRTGTFKKNFSSDDFLASTQTLSQSLLNGYDGRNSPFLLNNQLQETQSTPDIPLTMSTQASQSKPVFRQEEKNNKQSQVVDYLSKWSESTFSQRIDSQSQSQASEARRKILVTKESGPSNKEIVEQLSFVSKVIGELPEVLSNAFDYMRNDLVADAESIREESRNDLREACCHIVDECRKDFKKLSESVDEKFAAITKLADQGPVLKLIESVSAGVVKMESCIKDLEETARLTVNDLTVQRESLDSIRTHVDGIKTTQADLSARLEELKEIFKDSEKTRGEFWNVVAEELRSGYAGLQGNVGELFNKQSTNYEECTQKMNLVLSDVESLKAAVGEGVSSVKSLSSDVNSVCDQLLDKQLNFMKSVLKDLKKVEGRITSASSDQSKQFQKFGKMLEQWSKEKRQLGKKEPSIDIEQFLFSDKFRDFLLQVLPREVRPRTVSVECQTEDLRTRPISFVEPIVTKVGRGQGVKRLRTESAPAAPKKRGRPRRITNKQETPEPPSGCRKYNLRDRGTPNFSSSCTCCEVEPLIRKKEPSSAVKVEKVAIAEAEDAKENHEVASSVSSPSIVSIRTDDSIEMATPLSRLREPCSSTALPPRKFFTRPLSERSPFIGFGNRLFPSPAQVDAIGTQRKPATFKKVVGLYV